MKNLGRLLYSLILLIIGATHCLAQCGNLYIEGVIDGPLSGGTPKAIQLCANAPISDLSIYGLETAVNGAAADGEDYTFPADALASGDCIWVTGTFTPFNSFFGFDACYQDGSISNNGDDVYLLYCSGSISDTYGEAGTDGTGTAWEFLDGWANATDMVPNATFDDTEWTYSGINALDGEMTNASATTPYPNVMVNCPATLPNVSIDDISMNETNSGTVTFTFTVTTSTVDATDITFDINTMDGSATTTDNDYVSIVAGSGVIVANTTSTTIDVTINGDTNIEMDEDFSVILSNISSNANLLDDTGVGTITDDDTPIPEVILISEISVCDQQLELFNAGTTTVDLSAWRLCNFPQYDDLGDVAAVTVISGSLNLAPMAYVTVEWSDIDIAAGELGLYLPTGGFGDPASIHDYVQYNSTNNQRAGVAVTAGVWDDAALDITAPTGVGCSTIIANAANPTSSNSTTWCEASSSTIDPAGTNSSCSTGIVCPQAGDIIVSEIMQNPSAVDDNLGEWFEVYNTSNVDIDLEGWTISDLGADNHTISNGGPLILASNQYLVFGINANSSTNGGLTVDYEYSSLILSNGDDEIILTCDPLGAVVGIDTVAYDGGPIYPDPTGASMSLNPSNLGGVDNNVGMNWCESTTPYGNGDFGTPGSANDACLNLPLISIDNVSTVEGNSATSTLTFTVTLTAADAADVTFEINTQDDSATIADNDYDEITATTGTITAGNLMTTIDVTINGDTNIETDEDFNILLTNISSNALIQDGFGIGTNVGDLVISEIMQNPSAVNDNFGEYFEVYNSTGSDINMFDYVIKDSGSNTETIPISVIVPANGYALFGINDDNTTNGGLPSLDYNYSNINLGNSTDDLLLVCNSLVIDSVGWDNGVTFPDPNGASMNLNPMNLNAIDNDDGSNWCESTSVFGSGDLGTPKAPNNGCGIIPTPELSIDDVVMSEGNSGSTIFTFTVSSSIADATADITFDINTTNGTATSPSDFTAIVNGTGTITMGMLTTTIDVIVNGDTDLEPNEAFGITISNISANAAILDGTGMGIINDDDNSCPTDYAGPNALTGTITGTEDFETDGVIESTQIIDATAVVDYDSATEINLNADFEVVLGAVFSAFIDGCGGTMIQEENTDIEKK